MTSTSSCSRNRICPAQNTPCLPVGCRKVEQLMDNLEALDIALSEEQIQYLESVLPFDAGFQAYHHVG
ncbi:hypothetical protein OBBRIDRAFT_792108 [Obba rivulosa]|uniref:Uncharacterized protein n=1 Tax=Obba rivulosa TaxID=1052685 RepID=A0A8E2DM28_9APHY|nr:hypothetical protein OBBRIDRAFT_792108 [Obba rivulosa]